MNVTFDLPVTYRGEELHLTSRLLQLGYTHKFEVVVDDVPIFFERDEEGAFRAITNADTINKTIKVDLLQAIAEAIEKVLK